MSTAGEPGAEADFLPGDVRDVLDRQTEVLELIAAATQLADVLTAILSGLEQLMDGARCSVLLLDRERGTLHHGAAPSLSPRYVAMIDGLSIGANAGSCGTAAWLNAPVVATDVRTDPRWAAFRDAALQAGLQSCWSSPIEGTDGLPVGTFAVYHPRPHSPSRRDHLLVDRFAHLASVAITHARLLGDLVQSEERFRRSFDDNALGMAILGPDRAIVSSNNALTALLAPGGRDFTGSALTEIITPKGRDLASLLDELGCTGAGPLTFEALLHGDEREVAVEVTVSLLRGRDGSTAQYVVNVLDLTERRAAERDRRARLESETARRIAEEHSNAKSELLAAVGHEARTPIQAIVGFAELLGTIDLDEGRRREALAHIDAAARHVMDLLADVLDLSRIEANALPVVLEPICLREVVVEVFGLLSPAAESRQVDLHQNLGQEWVHADRRRLRQVLLNLAGNAIRHGKVGGQVRIHLRPTPEPDALLMSVDDDGPGIPPELLPRMFTPFSRADLDSEASTPSGAVDPLHEESIGLGLGLAHGLMSAMGGELSLAGTTRNGTSMLLRMPRADGPPP